jgi:hypothetical protein
MHPRRRVQVEHHVQDENEQRQARKHGPHDDEAVPLSERGGNGHEDDSEHQKRLGDAEDAAPARQQGRNPGVRLVVIDNLAECQAQGVNEAEGEHWTPFRRVSR